MKKLSVLLIGLFLLSLGCIRVHSYVKPDVNFSAIKKVAIVKLGSQVTLGTQHSTKSESQGSTKSEKSEFQGSATLSYDISQIVTDAMVMALMQKGIDVVEANKLKNLINENLVAQSGLTDSERQILVNSGMDSIIVGTIFVKQKLFKEIELTFSLRMFDARSGKLIWSANVVEVDFDNLNQAANKIADTIPIQ